jgi:hypothetical protein
MKHQQKLGMDLVFLGVGKRNEGKEKKKVTGDKPTIFRSHESPIMKEDIMKNKMT